MKHRLERVNEVIRRELSEIVRREVIFSAPLVTIQSADISPDLKSCHIYVSVIGNDAQKKEAIVRLLDKRKHLQHLLMKRVVLSTRPSFTSRSITPSSAATASCKSSTKSKSRPIPDARLPR